MSGTQAKVIEASGLRLSIGGKEILHGLDFGINAGSFVAIVGPNGAGKSTLLKCLNRLHDGWSGSLRLNGRPMRSFSRRELARNIGYVPQRAAAFPAFTVAEFMEMSRYAWHGFLGTGIDGKTAIDYALECTGILHLKGRTMDTLSGGEAQKTLIAAAIAQNAKVVLLDEPTTFLDPKYQHEVHALLARLNKETGITIIAVSHDLNNAALCADRMLGIKDGLLAYDLPPDSFMATEVLNPLFDTSFTFSKHPLNNKSIVV